MACVTCALHRCKNTVTTHNMAIIDIKQQVLYSTLFHAFALFQILLGGGEHELDAVELVDFAGAGIVVDGHDVGGRISFPQGFDNALAYDVVRQAAEGLGTYDVWYAFLDQFDHLTG